MSAQKKAEAFRSSVFRDKYVVNDPEGNLVEDSDGNTIYFDSYDDAHEYIQCTFEEE